MEMNAFICMKFAYQRVLLQQKCVVYVPTHDAYSNVYIFMTHIAHITDVFIMHCTIL